MSVLLRDEYWAMAMVAAESDKMILLAVLKTRQSPWPQGCGAAQVDRTRGLEFTRDHGVPEPNVALQVTRFYSWKGLDGCWKLMGC
jgi:hypothetical protein